MPDQLCESVGIDGNSGVDLETGSSGEKFDEVLAPPARWQERRGWGKQKKKTPRNDTGGFSELLHGRGEGRGGGG